MNQMNKVKKRSVCVRLNPEEDKKLDSIKKTYNLNESDAIRKSINIMDDSEELVSLHHVLGEKIVNIIAATNGLEESISKKIIINELEVITCLLAK